MKTSVSPFQNGAAWCCSISSTTGFENRVTGLSIYNAVYFAALYYNKAIHIYCNVMRFGMCYPVCFTIISKKKYIEIVSSF